MRRQTCNCARIQLDAGARKRSVSRDPGHDSVLGQAHAEDRVTIVDFAARWKPLLSVELTAFAEDKTAPAPALDGIDTRRNAVPARRRTHVWPAWIGGRRRE